MELFVLDDGWFGGRNTEHAGLGDWVPNRNKLPGGIRGLSEKIEGLGNEIRDCGFEPEMVNRDSDLYREHPDWILRTPDRPSCHGRFQYVLDFSRKESGGPCVPHDGKRFCLTPGFLISSGI